MSIAKIIQKVIDNTATRERPQGAFTPADVLTTAATATAPTQRRATPMVADPDAVDPRRRRRGGARARTVLTAADNEGLGG